MALTDGLRGSDDFKDGRWQGYQGQDVEVIIDLKQQTEIHRISMGFLQSSYSWILMPSRVQYWISDDGREYTLAGEAVIDCGAERGGDGGPRSYGRVLRSEGALRESDREESGTASCMASGRGRRFVHVHG